MTGSNTSGKVLWSEDWRRETRESLEVRGLTRDGGTGARKVTGMASTFLPGVKDLVGSCRQ